MGTAISCTRPVASLISNVASFHAATIVAVIRCLLNTRLISSTCNTGTASVGLVPRISRNVVLHQCMPSLIVTLNEIISFRISITTEILKGNSIVGQKNSILFYAYCTLPFQLIY